MYHYQKNIGDYRSATMHLSLVEHGVYNQLLDWYYLDEQPLSIDNRTLFRRLSARSEIEQQAVLDVLSEMFIQTEAGWVHKRVEREIAQYKAKAEQARAAGKLGGRPSKKGIGSDENRGGFEKEADAKPTANREPLTNNQEPLTKEEGDAPRKRSAPPPKPMAKVDDLVEAGFSPESAAEFIAHKAGMKAPLTERAWRDHLAESQKAGWTPLQAAEKVMAKTWKGFEAKYVAKEAPPNRATPISFADHDEARRRRRWEETTGRKWPTDNQTPDTFDMDEPPMRIEA